MSETETTKYLEAYNRQPTPEAGHLDVFNTRAGTLVEQMQAVEDRLRQMADRLLGAEPMPVDDGDESAGPAVIAQLDDKLRRLERLAGHMSHAVRRLEQVG